MSGRVVHIDPNVRVEGNQTYSGFEDCNWSPRPLDVGTTVTVLEPESGLTGTGIITTVDTHRALVYLKIEWRTLIIQENISP